MDACLNELRLKRPHQNLQPRSEVIQQQKHIQAPKPLQRLKMLQKPKPSSSAFYLEDKEQHQQPLKPQPRLKLSQQQPAKQQAFELQPQPPPQTDQVKIQQNRPNVRPQNKNGAEEFV
ncbi:hypothetical protein HELRODRAFT_178522 [Helobdella robusta]|uniref:Uncharacterized protein n=1 Tax=Helobdella robusta TaxID=6412 RepID=T1FDA8_HELRO|nr:hypothetical protein HELRODRAFT_178522 [Helobdella robusta]ESN97073.1 hypothetical protein HELRODRAFT_178522 [Helobdella robusta]